MIILWIVAAILLVMVFFAGWAGVFLACFKLSPDPVGKKAPAWKWMLFWGVYLGSVLAYPVVAVATVVQIIYMMR